MADPCLYHLDCDGEHMLMAVVVDDTLSYSIDPKLEDEVFKALIQKFNFKVIGPCKWFLGMQISPLYESMMVDQEAFLKAALD